MEKQQDKNGLGLAGTWLGGSALAVALANGGLARALGWGFPPGPPPFGGPGGPVSQEVLGLTAENAQLKAQVYTDGRTTPLAVEQARQGEQITAMRDQLELRQRIVDQRIDSVAQVASLGMQALQQAVASISKLGVPEASIIPAPATVASGG